MEPIPPTRAVFEEMRHSGDTALEEDVLEMGRAATEIVPSCVGLSLADLGEGMTFTLAATSVEVAALDAVQYVDDGPCVAAAHTGDIVEVNPEELLDEGRWAMYARASAAAGVASSLTLPIEVDGHVIGTVNLYASVPDAFTGYHKKLAHVLGASAEYATSNADLTFSTRLTAAQAPTLLADQRDVDITIGILSTHQDIDIMTARAILREAATRAGITEAQAARAIRWVLTD